MSPKGRWQKLKEPVIRTCGIIGVWFIAGLACGRVYEPGGVNPIRLSGGCDDCDDLCSRVTGPHNLRRCYNCDWCCCGCWCWRGRGQRCRGWYGRFRYNRCDKFGARLHDSHHWLGSMRVLSLTSFCPEPCNIVSQAKPTRITPRL